MDLLVPPLSYVVLGAVAAWRAAAVGALGVAGPGGAQRVPGGLLRGSA